MEKAYLEQAIGSSQEPGTDCTTIFDSLTPDESSFAFAPARRGSIMAIDGSAEIGVLRWWGVALVFQRACTIPIRRALPSSFGASPGPLSDAIVIVVCVNMLIWICDELSCSWRAW